MLGIDRRLHVVSGEHSLRRLHKADFRFQVTAQLLQSRRYRAVFHDRFIFAVGDFQTLQITLHRGPFLHAAYTADRPKLGAVDGNPFSPDQPPPNARTSPTRRPFASPHGDAPGETRQCFCDRGRVVPAATSTPGCAGTHFPNVARNESVANIHTDTTSANPVDRIPGAPSRPLPTARILAPAYRADPRKRQ